MSEDKDINDFEEELRADSYTGNLETHEAQIDAEHWQHDPEEWWRDSSNYQRQAMLVGAGITDLNLASFEYYDLSEDIQRQLAEDSIMYSPESKANEDFPSESLPEGKKYCPRCRGTGRVGDDGMYECERCNGDKWVASEAYGQGYGIGTPAGDIIWKHFNAVHSMDQDDVFCNHCGKMMTEPVRKAGIAGDGIGGLAQQQVYFDHLKQHGITESHATEDSLVKIEDDNDDDTQVTVLDEWENETDPDVGGKTEDINATEGRPLDDWLASSDNYDGITLEDTSQEWWDNNANPSEKARILNKTGSPVENTFDLPSYDSLSEQTKTYLSTRNNFSFESKANEGVLPCPNCGSDNTSEYAQDYSEAKFGTSDHVFTCRNCGNEWESKTSPNSGDSLWKEIQKLEGESKANEKMWECGKCDGTGKDEFGYCYNCKGTGQLSEEEMERKYQSDQKWKNMASQNDDYIDGSDVPKDGFYESKATESLDYFDKKDIIDDSPMEEQLYDVLWAEHDNGDNGKDLYPSIRDDFCRGGMNIESLVSPVQSQRSKNAIASLLRWADGVFKANESKATEDDINLNTPEGRDMMNDINKHASSGGKWDRIKEPYEKNFDDWNRESKASENFTFYEDASHGWLEVPKSLLKELGIADQISSYSYQSGDMVYLEEDADLSLFISKHGNVNTNNPQDGKHIRNYGNYVGESVTWTNASFNRKLDALESLGITQGDAVRLASVAYEDLSEDLKKDLELPYTEEDAETEQEIFAQNEEKEEGVDYNNIGESRTARTKYECEHCNCGFKSNESLSIHYNQIHAVAPEPIEGYENWKDVADDLYEKEQARRKKGGESKAKEHNYLGGVPSKLKDTQCPECGSYDSLYEHETHGDLQCEVCGGAFEWEQVAEFNNVEVSDLGESKANEIGIHGGDGASFYDGKTFTCTFCGKIGDDFSIMAQEICPSNNGNGHQVPIFGDQVKPKPIPTLSGESLQSTLNRGFDNMMVMDQSDMFRCKECSQMFDIWRIEHELHQDPEEVLNSHLQSHESYAKEEGTSDGAKKGWLTRKRGGSSAEEPSNVDHDWAGSVGYTKNKADQNRASDLMDKYYELVDKPMEDLPVDGSAMEMEERKLIHAKGERAFQEYLTTTGRDVGQDVKDILEDENYHSLNRMLDARMETKKNPYDDNSQIRSGIDYDDDEVSDSQSDQDYYDGITQTTMETLQQSTVNGFPFFSYIGKPQQIFKDGKGGVVLYGMKRNPNSVRKVDIIYDEGADTYSVRFVSNRGKVKGEYSNVYFDQLSDIIVGKKGLGVESKASEEFREEDHPRDGGKFTSKGGGSSGKKAKDKPKNPYPKSHPKHDDAEKNPNAYGKHQDSHVADYDIKNEDERDRLNKQAKSIKDKGNSKRWEDKGFRVTKDNMGGIDVTKDDKSIWYSQSSEDNVDMFGDSDDWDDNAILDHLESGGAISKEASEGLRDLCENCKEGTHEYCLFDPEGSGNMCGCSVCGNDSYEPNEYQIMQRQFGSDGGSEISDLQFESLGIPFEDIIKGEATDEDDEELDNVIEPDFEKQYEDDKKQYPEWHEMGEPFEGEASDTGVSPERDYGQSVNSPVPSGTTFNESSDSEYNDFIQNKTDEDTTRNNLEKLQEEDGESIDEEICLDCGDKFTDEKEYNDHLDAHRFDEGL